MEKWAYATLLGNNEYFEGTLALIKSLRDLKAKYPIIVMVTDDVDELYKKYLRSIMVNVMEIKKINIDPQLIKKNNINGQPKWSNSFTKLAVFNLVEWDKIVFLDSDMVILKNVDNLFDHPSLSAVVADKFYPTSRQWTELNSGTLVLAPNQEEFKRLTALIPNNAETPLGDQDILHVAFPNWRTNMKLHLGYEYNIFSKHIDYYKKIKSHRSKKQEAILHYTGPIKPWMFSKGELCLWSVKNLIKGHFIEIRYFYRYRTLLKEEFKNFKVWETVQRGFSL